jgi:cyanate permease
MVAIPASGFLGSPVSSALLGLEGAMRLHGWQWIYIAEGLPTIVLGFLALSILRDGPHDARWLSAEQKEWLSRRLAHERAVIRPVASSSVWGVLSNRYVLAASLIYGGSVGASACLSIWLPQIIKSHGLTNWATGLVNAIPFGVAAILMVAWGRHSDRVLERVWHTALPLGITALGLALAFVTGSITTTVVIFSLAVTGIYAVKGPFWALSTNWFSAGTAAAGIAAVNAIGALWSGLSTCLLGVIKGATGSYAWGLSPLVLLTSLSAILVVAVGRQRDW